MKICSRQGKFELVSVNYSTWSERHNRDIISIFFNMNVCCVFSLESPHRGYSYEYKQHTFVNIKKKITHNHPKSAVMGFFPKGLSRTSSKQPWKMRNQCSSLKVYCIFLKRRTLDHFEVDLSTVFITSNVSTELSSAIQVFLCPMTLEDRKPVVAFPQ